MAPWGRRLRGLAAHLAPAAAETSTSTTTVTREAADLVYVRPKVTAQSDAPASVEPLPDPPADVAQALSAGLLDPSTLSPEIVRALMRPEPNLPSETEGAIAGLGPPRTPGVTPLWDAASGGVSAQGLARVRALQAAAIESRDFRLAEEYECLLGVVGDPPSPGPHPPHPHPHRQATFTSLPLNPL